MQWIDGERREQDAKLRAGDGRIEGDRDQSGGHVFADSLCGLNVERAEWKFVDNAGRDSGRGHEPERDDDLFLQRGGGERDDNRVRGGQWNGRRAAVHGHA